MHTRKSMKSVIAQGATVAKAVEEALKKANMPQEFFIKLLEEAQSGFLGFGAKKAKIALFFKQYSYDQKKHDGLLSQDSYESLFDNQAISKQIEQQLKEIDLPSLSGIEQRKPVQNVSAPKSVAQQKKAPEKAFQSKQQDNIKMTQPRPHQSKQQDPLRSDQPSREQAQPKVVAPRPQFQQRVLQVKPQKASPDQLPAGEIKQNIQQRIVSNIRPLKSSDNQSTEVSGDQSEESRRSQQSYRQRRRSRYHRAKSGQNSQNQSDDRSNRSAGKEISLSKNNDQSNS